MRRAEGFGDVRWRRVLPVLLALAPVMTGAFVAMGAAWADEPALPVVRIGMVVDGPWERNDAFIELFQGEIVALTEGEFDVRFPAEALVVADWSLPGVESALDRVLAEPEVDMVLAMGVIASARVCRRGPLPKPVVAPFTIDVDFQQLPHKDGGSGVRNLSYLAIPAHVMRDLRAFREIVPFERLAVLMSGAYRRAVPELPAAVAADVRALGIEYEVVEVGERAAPALAALPDDAEAVFLMPILSLAPGELDRLVAGLRERRLPTFSLFGEDEVRRGVLAGLTPDDTWVRLARRVALHVQSILLGDEPSTLAVAFGEHGRMFINMETARAIGVWPPWDVLTEAELIGEERKQVEREYNLFSAVRAAVDANLDLAAEELGLRAGEAEVRAARAPLLPAADVAAQGVWIDEDRAASFLSPAERTLSGVGTLSWLLYSDAAWAGYRIQQLAQLSRTAQREALRLDIAAAAATAYLNVLRTKTFERIQRDNLGLSRSNLELARVRRSVGAAGPAEVYRWESEIANNRKTVIEASARRNQAEIQLNRLLNRPLEERFSTADVGLREPGLVTSHERFHDFLRDPWSFRVFRGVLVAEGLAAAPKLREIDAAISTAERARQAAGRALWLPTLGVRGEVSRLLEEGGAGGTPPDAGALAASGLPVDLLGVEQDDTEWWVALSLSLPLSRGGGRRAERARARAELERRRVQRRAAAERIEQRIRSAAHAAGATYAGIEQTRAAAAAARRNLELVTDSYSQGAVSVLDLLDAQNAALVADAGAASAVYDFLIDLTAVERAVGHLDFLASAGDQEAWLGELERAFVEAGGSPRDRPRSP